MNLVVTSLLILMSSFTSASMKAIIYGKDCVKQVERTIPRNKPNCLLVRVAAAGLNPVDQKDVLGDKLPQSWTKTRNFVKSHYIEGNIIGFDFSGTVVASPVERYEPGDKVFGTMPPMQGTCAEYISVPVDQVCKKPTQLSFEEAAALPLVGLTALQALEPYSHSKSILIIGASGGTGHVAVSVARTLGYQNVVGVCSTRNVEFVRQQGATVVLDYTRGNLTNMVSDYCNEHVILFDVILDCVTSADPRDSRYQYPQQLKSYCIKRYIRLGGPSFDWIRAGMERVLPFSCFVKEQLFWIRFPKSSDELQQLAEWADEGKLKPRVSQVFDFSTTGVQQAFDLLHNRRVQGKLVVRVSTDNDS